MEDRLTRGFAAGIIGGLMTNVWGFFIASLQPQILRFADWAGIIIFGHAPPFETLELIIALTGQVVFSGILGVIFAYLLLLITSRNLLFKGWLFSIAAWFFIYAITALFKVEGTIPLSVKTVLANIVAASLFGLTQALAFRALTENLTSGQYNPTRTAVPARKPFRRRNSGEDSDQDKD